MDQDVHWLSILEVLVNRPHPDHHRGHLKHLWADRAIREAGVAQLLEQLRLGALWVLEWRVLARPALVHIADAVLIGHHRLVLLVQHEAPRRRALELERAVLLLCLVHRRAQRVQALTARRDATAAAMDELDARRQGLAVEDGLGAPAHAMPPLRGLRVAARLVRLARRPVRRDVAEHRERGAERHRANGGFARRVMRAPGGVTPLNAVRISSLF